MFAIGSVCFLVGPFPGFVELVGAEVDAFVFFAGSLFFTCAALLQLLHSSGRLGRVASVVQFAGTLFFNVSTFHALQAGLDTTAYNRLVWRPDARGSLCFLVSGIVAYVAVRELSHRSTAWRVAAVNLVGCVAFGIAAIAGHLVRSTGSALDLAAANTWTSLGALCFLVSSLLLLPRRPQAGTAACSGGGSSEVGAASSAR